MYMSTKKEALVLIKNISSGNRILIKSRKQLDPYLKELLVLACDHKETVNKCIVCLTADRYGDMNEVRELAKKAYQYLSHFEKHPTDRFDLLKNNDPNAKEIEPTLHRLVHVKINVSEYCQHSVLYAFIVLIDDRYNVIKFGYASKILKRIKSLKTDYPGYRMELIGLKHVADISDETTFFQIIDSDPDTRKYKTKIGNRKPKELYYFSPRLMELFDTFIPPGLEGKLLDVVIEKERTKQKKVERDVAAMSLEESKVSLEESKVKLEEAKIKLACLEKEIELEKLKRGIQ